MNWLPALLLCLANFSCHCVPLPDEEGGETSTTPLPALVTIEVKIKKATDTIENLNKNIIDSLAGTIDRDALSTIGTFMYADAASLLNATASNSTNSNSNSTTPGLTSASSSSAATTANPNVKKQENTTATTAAPNTDQKFSVVLKDLQEFEDHLQESIRNFTATRQFAYRTMLRPMLQQVQQLRANLTHLRNHMVGYHAVTELQQQVNALTTELGDVITSGRPSAGLEIQAESDSVKPLQQQESLYWVSE